METMKTEMRKSSLLAIALFLFSPSFAQETNKSKTQYYRYEMNVSMIRVFLPESQWDDYEDRVYDALAYQRDHDNGFAIFPSSAGGISISYYYHLSHRLAIGTMAAFTTCETSLNGDFRVPVQVPYEYWDREERIMKKYYETEYTTHYFSGGKIKGKSFFLLPSLKWSWLNNSWCSLYMKASIGLHYQRLETDAKDVPLKRDEDLDESNSRMLLLL